MSKPDPEDTRRAFHDAVNMPPAKLKAWLGTPESKETGWRDGHKVDDAGDGESVGHEMGGHIVELLGKKAGELSDEDLARMRKVTGYVRRHLAQGGPDEDVEHSRWRYSLMNWGHDPLKD